MLEQIVLDGVPCLSDRIDRAFHVDRVPKNDCGDDEIKSAGSIALVLKRTISQFAKPMEEHRSRECVLRLALVEADLNAAPKLYVLKPFQSKKATFDPAKFPHSHGQAILTRVAAELAKHKRSGHGSLLDGSGKSPNLVPVTSDMLRVDRSSGESRKGRVLLLRSRRNEYHLVRQIADTRRESESQEVHEREEMIREASSIGIVLLDPQVRFVIEQAIQDVRGIAHADVDDFRMERCVRIRNVCVEQNARLASIYYPGGARKALSVASSGLTQTNLMQYGYREDGLRTKLAFADGTTADTMTWSRKPSGRVQTIADGSGQAAHTITYNFEGMISQDQMASGTISGFTWDNEGEINGFTDPAGAIATISYTCR